MIVKAKVGSQGIQPWVSLQTDRVGDRCRYDISAAESRINIILSTQRRLDIGLGLARISSTPGISYGVTDLRSVGRSAGCRREGPIS